LDGETAERLSVEMGVSARTIDNDAAFALAVDYLCGDATAVEMGAILSGDTEWTRKDIMDRHASALRAAEAAAKAAGASEKEAKQAAKAVVDDAPAPETVPQEVLDAASDAADEVVEETAAIAEEAKEQNVKPRAVTKAKAKAKREAAQAAQAAEDPNPPTITLADWREWMPQQPDCDLLLTDPPYMTDVDDIASFAAEWLPVAMGKVKPTGRAYVCIGAYPLELAAYLQAAKLVADRMYLANVLVWTYRNTLGPSPALDYKQNWQAILYFRGPDAAPLNCPVMTEQFSVQDINAPDGRIGDRYHTWQKPDELAERLIRHATQPGDLVLDTFAGTGTFILAASRLGRGGRGCDFDESMLDIATQRGCARG
jgi:DNA modification methylase